MTSLSNQGIWSDGIIIEPVADNLNLKIHITESLPNFAEFIKDSLLNFIMCQPNI